MNELTLWLSVSEHGTFGTAPAVGLFTRTIETPFLPPVGAEVFGWDDGMMLYVRRVYWEHDGRVHAELAHLVLDPTESELSWWREKPNYGQAWWTQPEGTADELVAKLTDAGWTLYSAADEAGGK